MPIPFFSKKKNQPMTNSAPAGAPASSKCQSKPAPVATARGNRPPQTAEQKANVKVAAVRAPRDPSANAPKAVRSGTAQPRRPAVQGGSAVPRVPVRKPSSTAAGTQNQVPQNKKAPNPNSNPSRESAHPPVKAPNALRPSKPPKPPKEPRGRLITAEGVSAFLFVMTVSILIYAIVCGAAYGIFYGMNHFRFEWSSDITVKLDDSTKRPPQYTTSEKLVFRNGDKEAYIAMSRLTQSLGLSSVGDSTQMKFYKTSDLENSVVFTNKSNEAIVNGVTVRLPAPVYISGATAYVPIAFFNYYTSGVTLSYDSEHMEMTVLYTVNEELSTPKRKVLEEFKFAVNTPSGLEEMTEEEWFEYVGSIS